MPEASAALAQESLFLPDEQATIAAGGALSGALACVAQGKDSQDKDLQGKDSQASVVFLLGDLGAGKTTFSRGVVQGFGHDGAVKSPTYTLVEPYELTTGKIYHFDLYRLADPEELDYMGIDEYFHDSILCLIEWPERGQGLLPPPDLVVTLSHMSEGRNLSIQAYSEKGTGTLEQFLLNKRK